MREEATINEYPLGSGWNPYPDWDSVPPELKYPKRFIVNAPYDLQPIFLTEDELRSIPRVLKDERPPQLMRVQRTYRHCLTCDKRRRFIFYEYDHLHDKLDYAVCHSCGSRQDHERGFVATDEIRRAADLRQARLDWHYPLDVYWDAFVNTVAGDWVQRNMFCWNLSEEKECYCAHCRDPEAIAKVLGR